MNTHSLPQRIPARLLALLTLLVAGLLLSAASSAQVPVDENGNPIAPIDEGAIAGTGSDLQPLPELMTAAELQALVGPVALYPDDLLAIVLPASTYPLEIVQAARFLEAFEQDKSLQPDDAWDESITALLNYPEVVDMMNDDIDWTWRLGEAVVSQQSDVIAAVEAFRDRAYAAGNLKTDERQIVKNNDGIIEIAPANEEIIYVPYYEPERVVVYQPRPVYYYYPRPYPVYYYPYPHGYNFYRNYFWGVTTAYAIGWNTHHLHVFHHSYWGHPYYGRSYYGNWYRRPSITVYNTWYGDRRSEVTRDHYRDGDFWRPRHTGGARPGFHRSRDEVYRDRRRASSSDGYRERAQIARSDDSVVNRTAAQGRADVTDRVNNPAGRAATNRRQGSDPRSAGDSASPTRDAPIRFRERAAADTQRIRDNAAAVQTERRGAAGANVNRTSTSDEAVRFRPRERQPAATPAAERARHGMSGNGRTGSPAVRPQTEQRQAEPRRRTPAAAAVRGQRSTESTPARSSSSNNAVRLRATPRAPAATSRPAPSRAQPVTRTPQRSSAPTRATPRAAPRVSAPRAAAPGATAAPKATSRTTPARPAARNDRPDRTRDR